MLARYSALYFFHCGKKSLWELRKDRAFSFKQKYNEIRKSGKKVNEASEVKNGEFQQENNGEIKENKGADEGNKRIGKENEDY